MKHIYINYLILFRYLTSLFNIWQRVCYVLFVILFLFVTEALPGVTSFSTGTIGLRKFQINFILFVEINK